MTYFPCNRTPTLGSSKGNRVSNYKILKNKLAIIVIANPDETFRCTILEPLHFLKFDTKISFKPINDKYSLFTRFLKPLLKCKSEFKNAKPGPILAFLTSTKFNQPDRLNSG